MKTNKLTYSAYMNLVFLPIMRDNSLSPIMKQQVMAKFQLVSGGKNRKMTHGNPVLASAYARRMKKHRAVIRARRLGHYR